MTAHDHSEYVPGCFRCELGRDEVSDMGDDILDAMEAMHDASTFAHGAAKAILEGQLHRFQYAGRKSKQGKDCDCDSCSDQRTRWVPYVSPVDPRALADRLAFRIGKRMM